MPARSARTGRGAPGPAGAIQAGEKGYLLFLTLGLPPDTHREVTRVFTKLAPEAIGSSNPRSIMLAMVARADVEWAEPYDPALLETPRMVAVLADRCVVLEKEIESLRGALAEARGQAGARELARAWPICPTCSYEYDGMVCTHCQYVAGRD